MTSALTFGPPCVKALTECASYPGYSNFTLPAQETVRGAAFDRFIQIWFENTDYQAAATSSVFAKYASQGQLLTNAYGVTHPSEPNYIAAVGGDFFGLGDDSYLSIPSNASTIVDLLEAKNISWASYQESMPTDGFAGAQANSTNYLPGQNGTYTFWKRKHSPLSIFESVESVPQRALRIRNFNDLAADVAAGVMPQWSFLTPNMVNDAHDTSVAFAGEWLDWFFSSALNNTNFNNNRTLILVTFDENENYDINNQIFTFLTGGALPENLRGTNDSTYHTHYSSLSSVEANWQLGSLGRGDTNKTMSNVFEFMASKVNYTNMNVSAEARPYTNATTTIPGPLNAEYWQTLLAPNVSAIGAGGGKVFVAPGTNLSLTAANAPAPVNLTALFNETTYPANHDAGLSVSAPTSTLSGGSSVANPPTGTLLGSVPSSTASSSSSSSTSTKAARRWVSL